MKLILTLDQLKRVVHSSNEIKYPLTFRNVEDFDKWVQHVEKLARTYQ
ncbi:hypothetical protein [Pseudofulvibacter geojedonensis]|uniref:PH domain-containing protein n=1 Tax=Pseudofulvibacter geojedonensis TaxID=1123758 RepID=A0ABW3I041_9FLAO